MDEEPLRRLIQSLGKLADAGGGVGLSDAELLERFVAQRDGAAFELLIRRHGAMVLGVCRRLLPDSHEAEDAFQATFLALVRRAASISRGAALAAWLYRVAYRMALRLRASRAKRAAREGPGVDLLPAPSAEDAGLRELRAVLDEEVGRLPERWRAAFVLCHLEGRTGAEAARELRCPPGTVSSRLTRARERLRRRLARRGLAPAVAGALAATQSAEALAAPSPLVVSTLQACLWFSMGRTAGPGLSAPAVTLAEGVLRAMSLTRVKIAALWLLLLSVLATGGVLARNALTAAPPQQVQGKDPPAQAPGEKAAGRGRPVAVQVVKPLPGGVARTTTQLCTVQAFESANVFPVLPGYLKNQTVDIGDFVKKGQVLAQVDAPLLALDEQQAAVAVLEARGLVQESEARVAVAKAEVKAAASFVRKQRAAVDSAQAMMTLRQRQFQRVKKLHELKTVDASLLEEKEQELEAARAQVAAAKAALVASDAEVEVKESKVLQAEAAVTIVQAKVKGAEIALQKARATLELTRILSPFDGVVTQRSYQNGDYVRPSEQGGRIPLLTVERIDRLRAIVQVSERDALLAKPGIPVNLSIDALPNDRFTDYKVARVGFAVAPQTRTMRVEIDVPNPRRLLRPGLTGTATLQLQKPSPRALRVHVSCLVPLADGKRAVYVVRDGKAQQTIVRVGHNNGTEAEILAGLGPDDRVVIDPRGFTGKLAPVEIKGKTGGK